MIQYWCGCLAAHLISISEVDWLYIVPVSSELKYSCNIQEVNKTSKTHEALETDRIHKHLPPSSVSCWRELESYLQ